tara:strand:+ start:2603 stop:3139 length:537 start_codon:yes stop_codon:yes gene_type:complete
MNTENLERYLNSFGKYVVQQSRSNLTKAKKNVNKSLYNSIRFKVVNTPDGFSVNFYMEDYGTFVDKGVSGNKNIQEYKTWDERTVESPYKYKSKQPPPGILEKWIQARGLKGRDKKTGRFISNKSLAFLIGKSIKLKGIKGISFFQRPLSLGLKRFGPELLKNLKEDIIDSMNKTTVN